VILPEPSPDQPQPASPAADGEHDPGAAIQPASATEVASPPSNELATAVAPPSQDAFMRLLTGSATLPPLVTDPVQTRSRRWLALLVGAVVLVVVAGVVVAVAASGLGTPAAAPTQTYSPLFDQPVSPSPVASSPAAVAPSWTPTHTGDLARFLVPMPAGAKPTKTPPANEVLDIKKAADFGVDPSAWTDMLYTWQFSRGVVRRWTVGAEEYQVVLFQFYNPANAEGFTELNKRGLETSTEWRSATAATYGSVFVSTTPTLGFNSQLAIAQAEDILVIILASTKLSTSTSVVENLLHAEYHLL
jgi:hypothetical protein